MEAGLCRDAPTTQFRCKAEHFSALLNSSVERYESPEFVVGDYKWKLVFYPRGNKEKDVNDHISLYLVLVNNNSSDANKELKVTFSLLALDQIEDKCLSLQGVSKLGEMHVESGFDKFLSHKIFNDPSYGYLINDTCLFGADIFYSTKTIKGQCLSMIKYPVTFKYMWEMEKFSELTDEFYYSSRFRTRGHDWKVLVYPKGNESAKGKFLSLYLVLADCPKQLSLGTEILVDFTLRVIDQVNQKHKEKKPSTTMCLGASRKDWGWRELLPLSDLNESTGFLVNDTFVLEAEVMVLGSTESWDRGTPRLRSLNRLLGNNVGYTHISMRGDKGAIGITIKACTIKGAKSREDIMEAGLSRLLRDAPPTHFRFKIESFSSLSYSSLERVESCEFEAGDYKWKLAIYPRGNKAKDHISLYLVLVNNNSDNKEILVTYSLFVFDHIQYKYLPVQGASRFHATKPESGFDKFLTLKIFNEPSNGYLIDDTCIFGAELFFIKSTDNACQ
ncbi:hypothetical protein IFM89_026828 [Coptis chinensis]|uniref:MATH domain-containing protein n=1 Tax=Coptis chinensis TaxID=261450 RepID=A0A835H5Q5_9MAGN|nr:hypothetical protein IFM89_026828 [Coptis chinensis]